MQKNYSNFIYLILVLIISACAGTSKTSSSTSDVKTGNATTVATEDFSKYRPKFTLPENTNNSNNAAGSGMPVVVPTNHINNKVAALMDTIAVRNKTYKYAAGYRISAYTGNDRKAAMDLRTAILRRMPDEPIYQQYKQPTWRIKVGDYNSRIEAQQVLLRLKDLMPNAMIVAEQINLR